MTHSPGSTVEARGQDHGTAPPLADPDGPTPRVEETLVRGRTDTPKSAAGERTIALGERVSAELFDHRARSAYSGDGDRVFVNPRTGGPFHAYDGIFRLSLAKAGIADYLRPSHDLRHSSITNAAAAGTPPEALKSRAGQLVLRDDVPVHRPRRREVPGGSAQAGAATLGFGREFR